MTTSTRQAANLAALKALVEEEIAKGSPYVPYTAEEIEEILAANKAAHEEARALIRAKGVTVDPELAP